MGLLTDVRGEQNVLTKFIIDKHNILCFLFYVVGIGLFLALAHESLNNKTYFSENALLPGLVHDEFLDEALALSTYKELMEEQKKYSDGIPYPWLLAKFSQLGLDVYTHNFTLNYPLSEGKQFYGKNVYAILRAPRAASTEALVLSTPYRSPSSMHPTTTPSIALMISFAKFCKQQKYWAKDIIFLIVDHEQLGMQAWLEAYLGIEKMKSAPLDSGTLSGRAGAIQAAINLEFHSITIGSIDIKIEGLNGQLPNLDLVNLADRITTIERIRHTFKQRSQIKKSDPFQQWLHSFETLSSMVLSMATGVPTGNHGLYHRYGIEAITLEGFANDGGASVPFYVLGRVLEGIFRSLNNLLERFHQSYFFYLLPSLSRFVSIGTYIGSLIAFAAVYLVKALALWLQIREKPDIIRSCKKKKKAGLVGEGDSPSDKESMVHLHTNEEHIGDGHVDKVNVACVDELVMLRPETNKICIIFLITHTIGVVALNIPPWLTKTFGEQYTTEQSLYYGFTVLSMITLFLPLFVRLQNRNSIIVLNIIALLELATSLTAIGLHNFSLGFLIGAIYTPWIIIISPISKRLPLRLIQRFFWLLFHPFLIATVVVMVYTMVLFPEESVLSIIGSRGLAATQQALVFSVVDSLIYGNWLFNVLAAVFLPNWLCFYCMLFYSNIDTKLKKD